MIRMIVCGLIVIVGVFLASSQDSIRYVPYNKPLFSDLTPAQPAPFQGTVKRLPQMAGFINGDSVGFTYYDYITNGSSKRNILNYGDGSASIGRMAALIPDDNWFWSDRGTYWAYCYGSLWTELMRPEDVRTGWGNLGAFSNGKEVVVAHTGLRITTQNTAHVYDWTTRNTGTGALGGGAWPAMVVDGADYVHVIHTASGSGNTSAIRYDRYSVGGTVNDVSAANLWQITGADTLLDPREADGYDIHARGNKVVAVQASDLLGWMVLFTSTDHGTSWTHQVIEAFPTTFPYEVAYIDPYVFIDMNGNPHVVWTTLTATDATTFNLSANNAIMHWSAATGRTEVVHIGEIVDVQTFFDYHTPIAPGRNGGFFVAPSLGQSYTGAMYCAFSAPHSVADTSFDTLNRGYYSHLFIASSYDAGATWNLTRDANMGVTGWDVMFPNMAGWGGNTLDPTRELWVVANTDPLPGNNVQNATHQWQVNAIRVFTVFPYDDLHVATPPSQLDFILNQNHPNPFNPWTTITFEARQPGLAHLVVYNVLGEAVRVLHEGPVEKGTYSLVWDGRDRLGRQVASGLYLYRLDAGGFSKTRKMLLIR